MQNRDSLRHWRNFRLRRRLERLATSQGSRTVVVLMDTSLSMQWEKLESSYAAAAKLLRISGTGR